MGEAMIQSPVSPYLNSLFSIYFVKPLFFFFFMRRGMPVIPRNHFVAQMIQTETLCKLGFKPLAAWRLGISSLCWAIDQYVYFSSSL